MKLRLCFYAFALALTACSTTAADRYNQLAKKDSKDCAANVDALKSMPTKQLSISTPSDGELSSDSCLILKNGNRVSFEIYEFVATAPTQSVDILSFINARGMGFGGENTVVWPMVILQKDGSDLLEIHPPSANNSHWIRNVWSGDRLQSSVRFKNLIPNAKYRLTIASTIGEMGKEIPGYHSTVAAGRIVIGPLGKIEITLH